MDEWTDPPENSWTPKNPGPLIPLNILALEVVPWIPKTPGNNHEAHGPPRPLRPLALAVGPCGLWTPKTSGALIPVNPLALEVTPPDPQDPWMPWE